MIRHSIRPLLTRRRHRLLLEGTPALTAQGRNASLELLLRTSSRNLLSLQLVPYSRRTPRLLHRPLDSQGLQVARRVRQHSCDANSTSAAKVPRSGWTPFAAEWGTGAATACITAAALVLYSRSTAHEGAAPTAHAKVIKEAICYELDNTSLVKDAHEIRKSLPPPHQSLFRVVCILVYEDMAGNVRRITGTNAESSTIGGAICAERAAMCKLREVKDCKLVTKVIVVTDSPGPLAPGVLCREFLCTHLSSSTPVIMAGSGDDRLSATGGFVYADHVHTPSSRGNDARDGKEVSEDCARETPGERPRSSCECSTEKSEAPLSSAALPLKKPRNRLEESDDFVHGRELVIHECTVGDLFPWENFYGLTPRGEQTRLGFLKQQKSDDLSDAAVVEALGLDTAISKAYDGAWRATAQDKLDGVHPIRYAAAALFTNGRIEITHQVKALEYGATLDPVTLLAPAMLARRADGSRCSCILLADQFGNLHAPFAQARAFLAEHGFGDTQVVLHDRDGRLVVVKAKDLVPNVNSTS